MRIRIFPLACAAALCAATACAEGLDIGDMTLEELYTARAAIEARIDELEQSDDAQVYDSGSYLIGTDIPAGDYLMVENDDAVFASVIVREGVTEDSGLVAHHLINRQAVAHLDEGKWMTLTESRAYPLSQAAMDFDGVAGEGGYLVGVTLPAGRYNVVLDDKAPLSSYSVYDGVLGSNEQLLKFEVIREATELALSDGEYVELSGCRLEAAM